MMKGHVERKGLHDIVGPHGSGSKIITTTAAATAAAIAASISPPQPLRPPMDDGRCDFGAGAVEGLTKGALQLRQKQEAKKRGSLDGTRPHLVS